MRVATPTTGSFKMEAAMPDVEEQEGQETQEEQAATQAEEANATPEGQDAGQSLDASLLHAAERAGLDEEDIKEMGEKAPTVLGKLKKGQDEIARRFAKMGSQKKQGQPTQQGQQGEQGQQGQQFTQAPQPQQPQQPTGQMSSQTAMGNLPQGQQGQQPEAQGNEPALQDFEVPDLEELRAIGGDEVANGVEKLFDVVKQQQQTIQQMQPAVNEFQNTRQQEAIQKGVQQADSHLTDLAQKYDGYRELFGDQSWNELQEGSQAHQARQKVLNQAGLIRQNAKQRGIQMSQEEAVDHALSIMAPELQKDATRQDVESEVEEVQSQAINRPTQRADIGPDDKSDEAAVDAAAKKAAELGWTS